MRKLTIILLCLIQMGCFGTYSTRIKSDRNNTDIVGGYPYMSVASDAKMTFANPGCVASGLEIISFISIPIDIVVDTLLLPADLLTWPFGFKKQDLWDDSRKNNNGLTSH